MKKLIAIFLAAVLLGMNACQPGNPGAAGADPEMTMQLGQTDADSKETGTKVQWRAQYIRTNGSHDGVIFPSVRIIPSLQDLRGYYTAYNEAFDLERKEKVYSDTTIGFLDACDRYNEAFFEKNFLIFVLLEEGSGSIRHEVRSVEQTADKKLSIFVDRKVPEVGTDDMAQWHIILELSRDVIVEKSTDTIVFVEGMVSYIDDKVVLPQTEAEFKKPPEGALITPDGEAPLRIGGYSWFCVLGNGLVDATIADQAGRPLREERLPPVTVSGKYAETVYAPIPDGTGYAPTNDPGYLVKLVLEARPSSVTYTCWPETVWQNSNTSEETVVAYQDHAFYAKPGGYIYEIVAIWEDAGAGYHGSVNYYVYIVGGDR